MRTLIYYKTENLKPIGGPSGYLYNLYQEIKSNKDKELFFLDQSNTRISIIDKILRILYRCYCRVICRNPRIRFLKNVLFWSKTSGIVNLEKYDAVHFHSTLDMYSERRQLNKYKGIVILTTHSPTVFYKENIQEYFNDEEYKKYKKFLDNIAIVDEFAFERADYLVFPCEGAEEPYFHSWDKYMEYRNKSNVKYLLTGIEAVEFKKDRNTVRKECNIPKDVFVISFVGRHNLIKGYDILIDIFKNNPNVYFLCCGKIGNIKPPISDRWIEVGWTSDPYSYVNASDLFILPNRETYFDLALIQAISIGKMSLISNTGGNKFYDGLKDLGIYLFDNVNDATLIINKIINMDNEERDAKCVKLRKLFNEKFTSDVFYENYKQLMHGVIKFGDEK